MHYSHHKTILDLKMKIFTVKFFLKMVPLSRGKSPTENRLKEMKQRIDSKDRTGQ